MDAQLVHVAFWEGGQFRLHEREVPRQDLRTQTLIMERISNIDLLVYSQIATHPLIKRNSLDRIRFAIYKGLVRCLAKLSPDLRFVEPVSIVAGMGELHFSKGMA